MARSSAGWTSGRTGTSAIGSASTLARPARASSARSTPARMYPRRALATSAARSSGAIKSSSVSQARRNHWTAAAWPRSPRTTALASTTALARIPVLADQLFRFRCARRDLRTDPAGELLELGPPLRVSAPALDAALEHVDRLGVQRAPVLSSLDA